MHILDVSLPFHLPLDRIAVSVLGCTCTCTVTRSCSHGGPRHYARPPRTGHSRNAGGWRTGTNLGLPPRLTSHSLPRMRAYRALRRADRGEGVTTGRATGRTRCSLPGLPPTSPAYLSSVPQARGRVRRCRVGTHAPAYVHGAAHPRHNFGQRRSSTAKPALTPLQSRARRRSST
jgi:hypothetical protein